MEIPYWIQHADFSSEDFPVTDVVGATKAYENHNWDAELEARQNREEVGQEWCDPGIGFVVGDGRILHVCPMEEGRASVHYHYVEPRTFLRFFGYHSSGLRSNMDIERASASEFIQRFFLDDHEWLVQNTTF